MSSSVVNCRGSTVVFASVVSMLVVWSASAFASVEIGGSQGHTTTSTGGHGERRRSRRHRRSRGVERDDVRGTAPGVGEASVKRDDEDEKRRTIDHHYDLQRKHPPRTPRETLSDLASACDALGVDRFDVYGDFPENNYGDGSDACSPSSPLRAFELEVARTFGMEDALFLPSGVAAQNIALLVHDERRCRRGSFSSSSPQRRGAFACHDSSHLLRHENDAYEHLLGMDVIKISTSDDDDGGDDGPGIPPLRYVDAEAVLRRANDDARLGTLVLELPHRELGGKLTPWEDVLEISRLCRKTGVAFHCDGARIFEARAGHNLVRCCSSSPLSLADVAAPFDSLYVSFYKGLGGLSGAMLLGDATFVREARTWSRRFGANLFTQLPYFASGWAAFRDKISSRETREHDDDDDEARPTFAQKTRKMVRVVDELSNDEDDDDDGAVGDFLTFDPPVPETNMVHAYLRRRRARSRENDDDDARALTASDFERARDLTELRRGVRVFSKLQPVPRTDDDDDVYAAKFEWIVGDGNYNIPDDVFVMGLREFVRVLQENEVMADAPSFGEF